jgi:hypothetical protein
MNVKRKNDLPIPITADLDILEVIIPAILNIGFHLERFPDVI